MGHQAARTRLGGEPNERAEQLSLSERPRVDGHTTVGCADCVRVLTWPTHLGCVGEVMVGSAERGHHSHAAKQQHATSSWLAAVAFFFPSLFIHLLSKLVKKRGAASWVRSVYC